MRFATVSGRLNLVTANGTAVDLRSVEGAYDQWDAVLESAAAATDREGEVIPPTEFGNPAPAPRQVFAIGLNYADHAAETSFAVPEEPTVFTKFPASLAGPHGTVTLPAGGHVDWEVELVVVLGRGGHRIAAEDAWHHVAGLSVGQDLSERILQRSGPAPQFSLAKSFPRFSPIGPVLVTPDEFDDPGNLELGCLVNGEQVQKGKTADLVFPVPELIARLSAVTPLLPGDVIFTGTPSGVGVGRTPPRFLAPGDELVSYVSGIGEMRHVMAAAD
jgi:2-keto-4-pentenoate hydratase/2-oxohepta-3-ene-1,7-dioic acid hydratase in catechol pathway